MVPFTSRNGFSSKTWQVCKMNPNVWNIKEILSLPTGTCVTKSLSRNGATSDYSSISDSQFLFGSQFWPENSQGTSQEILFSSRASQQSSQEASDPKISINYQTKPFLLERDCKDKIRVPNFPTGKVFSILDRFEEDKKKAKEKRESDILATECLQFRENLENMKCSLAGIEENTTMGRTVLLEELKNGTKTLQKNISSLQDGIASLEEKVAKTGVVTTKLHSNVDNLQKNLEALRQAQGRDQNMLEEALSLLGTLVSKLSKPTPVKVTNSMVQTSPSLVERPFELEQSRQPDYSKHDFTQPNNSQPAVPSKGPCGRSITAGHRFTQRGRRKQPLGNRRPTLLPPQTRSRGRGCDENSQLPTERIIEEFVKSPVKEQDVSLKPKPLKQHNRETKTNKGKEGFLNPFTWSQDSNSSLCIKGSENLAWEQLPADPTTEVTGRARGFWQLFDISCDSD
ncbi:interactor of HORMAD1 protein 1 isoform X1 [Hypomesus transpacificus]|uniref:interactor of HORMAD1 protein 1 isoform X1 n=2 Tax=Hypomesus transpacificus TaxID=137520 RepID=UPI001F071DF3|nr:interactor of HORMAD1 protein 1 isoform X1 [Hypomesus transpacificus]